MVMSKVGYHNEHHDFPSVPWTRLPALRKLAGEFYEPLPSHESWPYVTWKFITDPNVGMWSRAKRTEKGGKIDEAVWTIAAGKVQGGKDEGEGQDERLEEEMEEAVGRGYASDSEDRKRVKNE